MDRTETALLPPQPQGKVHDARSGLAGGEELCEQKAWGHKCHPGQLQWHHLYLPSACSEFADVFSRSALVPICSVPCLAAVFIDVRYRL